MDTHDAYMKVREASGDRISGHLAVGRSMSMVVGAEEANDLHKIVFDAFNGDLDVKLKREAHVGFIEEYGYGENDRQDGSAVRAGSSVSRGDADNLRSEASGLIAQAAGVSNKGRGKPRAFSSKR